MDAQRGEVFAALYAPGRASTRSSLRSRRRRPSSWIDGATATDITTAVVHRRRRGALSRDRSRGALGPDALVTQRRCRWRASSGAIAAADPARAVLAARRGPNLRPRLGRRAGAGPPEHMHDPDRARRVPDRIARRTRATSSTRSSALEAASFTNPWTREMLARELRHSDVARVYVLRGAGPAAARRSAPAGWSSTSSTSTRSPSRPTGGGKGWRRGCSARVHRGRRGRRAPGDPRSAPIQRSRPPAVRTVGVQRQGGPDRVLQPSRGGRTDPVARQFPRSAPSPPHP